MTGANNGSAMAFMSGAPIEPPKENVEAPSKEQKELGVDNE